MKRAQAVCVSVGTLAAGLAGGVASSAVTAEPASAMLGVADAFAWGDSRSHQNVGAPGNWCMGTDRGPWVRFLQHLLWADGMLNTGDIDGIWGPKTENALGKLTQNRRRCLDRDGWNELWHGWDCRLGPGSPQPNCYRMQFERELPYTPNQWGAEKWTYWGIRWEVRSHVGGVDGWAGHTIDMKADYCTLAVVPRPPADIHPEDWSYRDWKGNFVSMGVSC